MPTNFTGYGVLGSDTSPKETTKNFQREIEARLVIPNPKGDGSVVTLALNLLADGTYHLRVEDQNRQAVKEVHGNILEETGNGGAR